MYFYHLLRLPCVPQGVPVANQFQMSSDINILYHSYQEWLKYQTFITFLVKIHVSGSIINSPLTGNDLCHSQLNGIFFHYF